MRLGGNKLDCRSPHLVGVTCAFYMSSSRSGCLCTHRRSWYCIPRSVSSRASLPAALGSDYNGRLDFFRKPTAAPPIIVIVPAPQRYRVSRRENIYVLAHTPLLEGYPIKNHGRWTVSLCHHSRRTAANPRGKLIGTPGTEYRASSAGRFLLWIDLKNGLKNDAGLFVVRLLAAASCREYSVERRRYSPACATASTFCLRGGMLVCVCFRHYAYA